MSRFLFAGLLTMTCGPAGADELVLAVEFNTPITPKAVVATRVTPGAPFTEKVDGAVGFRAAAGVVAAPTGGTYRTVLTLVDYGSDKSNTVQTTVVELEVGKPQTWGSGLSAFTATLMTPADAIQGTWDAGKGLHVVIGSRSLDYVYTTKPGEPNLAYRLELDPTAVPKRYTLKQASGLRSTDVLGVYEVDGDTLKLCFADGDGRDDPARRPTDFTPGPGRVSLTLRRTK